VINLNIRVLGGAYNSLPTPLRSWWCSDLSVLHSVNLCDKALDLVALVAAGIFNLLLNY
jgi:hypothetical protein